MNLVQDIMGFIDTAIGGAAESIYLSIGGSYIPIVTILATISIILYGLAVSFGVLKVRPGDLAQLVIRIVIIFTFGLSWPNFQFIYDALQNISDGLVEAIFSVAGGSAGSIDSLADEFATQAQTTAGTVIRAEGTITRGFLGAIMYIMLAALMAAYILVAGFAKIMIGILVGLAPFAFSMTVHRKTQFLFEAWMSSLIGYFMYPVAAAGVMGFIAAVADRAFITSAPDTLLGITGVVVIIIVGIYALYKIPTIASNITGKLDLGGIAPEALNIVSRPVAKTADVTKGMMSQIASGATTGGETVQRAQQSRRFGSATDMKLANVGARLANNAAGRFVQRRRDVQFARASNERIRAMSRK